MSYDKLFRKTSRSVIVNDASSAAPRISARAIFAPARDVSTCARETAATDLKGYEREKIRNLKSPPGPVAATFGVIVTGPPGPVRQESELTSTVTESVLTKVFLFMMRHHLFNVYKLTLGLA